MTIQNRIAAVAICFACACAPEVIVETEAAPTAAERHAAAEMVIRCAAAANPHSDEEGEDLVAQCERTARRIHYATFVNVCRVWKGGDVVQRERCDHRPTGLCLAACEAHR